MLKLAADRAPYSLTLSETDDSDVVMSWLDSGVPAYWGPHDALVYVPADGGAPVASSASPPSASASSGLLAPAAGPSSGPPLENGSGVTTVVVAASGNQIIDGLLDGRKWNGSITYTDPNAAGDYQAGYFYDSDSDGFSVQNEGFSQLTAQQMIGVHFGLNDAIYTQPLGAAGFSVEGMTGLTITYGTSGAGNGTLRLANSTDPGTAYAWTPDNSIYAGDAWYGNAGNLPTAGNYDWHTVLHEIGHALGLKHGHQTGGPANVALPANMNSQEYSIMTYATYIGDPINGYTYETWGAPQTFMMADIAALQYMYGADYTTNNGNTVYTWSPTNGQTFVNGNLAINPGGNRIFLTVWDGGGTDTYDLSNYTTNLSVDLRAGEHSTFSSAQRANLGGGPNGGFARGNVFNALMVGGNTASLIENATGGSGNDTIVGNQVNNVLSGNAGNDALFGDSLSDTLNGDAGNDVLEGGYDGDTLNGGSGDDVLYAMRASDIDGSGVGDTLNGDSNNDTIHGSAGGDVINGGFDADTLNGRGGNDAIYAMTSADIDGSGVGDTINGGDGNDTIYGSGGGDTIHGGLHDDYMDGRAGDDVIFDNDGDDTVYGGDGNDQQWWMNGLDYHDGGAGVDTIMTDTSFGGSAYFDLGAGIYNNGFSFTETWSNFENYTGTVAGGEKVIGSSGANVITTAGGNNEVLAGAGDDTINTGAGDDKVWWEGGTDFQDGGSGTDTIMTAQGFGPLAIFNLGAGTYTATSFVESWLNFENYDGTAGSGSETVIGSAAANILSGGSGNNTLEGGIHLDTLNGNGGNDILRGGFSTDTVNGGDGDDLIQVLNGEFIDIVDGGTGTDTLDMSAEIGTTGGIAATINLDTGAYNGMGGPTSAVNIENFIGTQLNDSIVGSSGVNVLDGQGGNDVISGGPGFGDGDTLSGGDGNDVLDGLSGADTLNGGNGDDTLRGGFFTDVVNGGAGNDLIQILDGEFIDDVDGGADVDTLDMSNESGGGAAASIDLGTGVFGGYGGPRTVSNVENFIGTQLNDTIVGSAAANVLDGQGGNDNIAGGAGTDTLLGAAGDDILSHGPGGPGESLDGGAGTDTGDWSFSVTDAWDIDLGAGTAKIGATVYASLISIENVIGGQLGDTITGTGASNVLDGRGGDDIIFSGSGGGNDTLFGGDGNDVLTADYGFDTLHGEAGNDTLRGGWNVDTVNGGSGNDLIQILNGQFIDDVDGGADIDTIDMSNESGGGIAVSIDLSTGVFNGYGGPQTVSNVENVIGTQLNDTIVGSTADNVLDGQNGNDVLTGGDGNDTLNGGDGDDNLYGGPGDDIVNGGNGNDTIVAGSGAGNDSYDGGNDIDTLDYSSTTLGVIVNLSAVSNHATGAEIGTDQIANVENVIGGSGNDTITANTANNNLQGSLGADTFRFAPANLTNLDTVVGGGGAFDDALTLTAAGTVTTAMLANVSEIETVNLFSGGNTVSLTNAMVASANMGFMRVIGGAGNDTVSAAAVTGAGLFVNFTAGGGNDALTGSAGTDNFTFAFAAFNASDTVNGGAASDQITFSTDAALTPALLAGVQSVERIRFLGAGANSLTLDTTFMNTVTGGVLAVTGAGGNDTVDASALASLSHGVALTAGGGNDTLLGGAGVDQMLFAGAAFNASDTYTGGTGAVNDRLSFTTVSTVAAAAFAGVSQVETIELLATGANSVQVSNALVSSARNTLLTVNGSAGNDTIDASLVTTATNRVFMTAGVGNDTLTGGAGADTFQFNAANLSGADTVVGGGGSDTLYLRSSGVVGAAAFGGVSGVETVRLNSAGTNTVTLSDALVSAAGGTLTVLAGAGNDTVDASGVTTATNRVLFNTGIATDTLTGGAGNDRFIFAVADLTGSDTLVGGGGLDQLFFTTSGTITVANLVNVSGIETVTLANGTNVMTVPNAIVTSVAGSLTIDGGTLDDTVDATVLAAANRVIINANSGDDTLSGGAGLDQFRFAAANYNGSDTVDGNGGSDLLYFTTAGTVAAAAFAGTSQVESIRLTDGTNNITLLDAMVGTAAGFAVSVLGGTGNDTINGAGVTTAPNRVTLNGNNGNDTLTGGAGNDTLRGGAGLDNLTGGAGDDDFVYDATGDSNESAGLDTIADMGAGDQLDFSALLLATSTSAILNRGTAAYLGSTANFFDDAGTDRAVAVQTNGITTRAYADSNGDGNYTLGLDLAVQFTGNVLANLTSTSDFIF